MANKENPFTTTGSLVSVTTCAYEGSTCSYVPSFGLQVMCVGGAVINGQMIPASQVNGQFDLTKDIDLNIVNANGLRSLLAATPEPVPQPGMSPGVVAVIVLLVLGLIGGGLGAMYHLGQKSDINRNKELLDAQGRAGVEVTPKEPLGLTEAEGV